MGAGGVGRKTPGWLSIVAVVVVTWPSPWGFVVVVIGGPAPGGFPVVVVEWGPPPGGFVVVGRGKKMFAKIAGRGRVTRWGGFWGETFHLVGFMGGGWVNVWGIFSCFVVYVLLEFGCPPFFYGFFGWCFSC